MVLYSYHPPTPSRTKFNKLRRKNNFDHQKKFLTFKLAIKHFWSINIHGPPYIWNSGPTKAIINTVMNTLEDRNQLLLFCTHLFQFYIYSKKETIPIFCLYVYLTPTMWPVVVHMPPIYIYFINYGLIDMKCNG